MVVLPIPLDVEEWAYLHIPRPMTPAQWEQMMRTLLAMRPGIVADDSEEQGDGNG
jgi:hypothetical protein